MVRPVVPAAPGAMALARMPRPSNWTESGMVIPMSPALAAEKAGLMARLPVRAAAELIVTIRPLANELSHVL